MYLRIFMVSLLSFMLLSCGEDKSKTPSSNETVVDVVAGNFLAAGLAESITTVTRTLSNGKSAACYRIITKSNPTVHVQGPWCPTSISDDASKGGIWLDKGNVYDVDGAFIKNLATFYNDNTWLMYNKSTGDVTRTLTQADFQAAANPTVENTRIGVVRRLRAS